MTGKVTITEDGREGSVSYSEGPLRTIGGYFEYGGDAVLAIVTMGKREDWERAHAWAIERRDVILRWVADEVIRQKAPGCVAEIDAESGTILVRHSRASGEVSPQAKRKADRAKAETFVMRYANAKGAFAKVVLVVALAIAALVYFGREAFSVSPATGVPLNASVRFDQPGPNLSGGVATLIQQTDPHPPRWSGRGGKDTVSVSLLILPFDGLEPQQIMIAKSLSPGEISLARILGSDGHTLWVDVAGLYGVRLNDGRLIRPKDLRAANPSLDPAWWEDVRGMDVIDGRLHIVKRDRSAAMDIDPVILSASPATPKRTAARLSPPDQTEYMAAGAVTTAGEWLGLQAEADLQGAFAPGRWIRPVESAELANEPRRLTKASLEESSDGARYRIGAIAPMSETVYANAALMRIDSASEPLSLRDPDSFLMMHTAPPAATGALVVSRVDEQGQVLWSADTGLDRFSLQQFLLGPDVCAFVGARPPVAGKLSEPMVVMIDHATGRVTTHSLWR